ncbi:MAG TPA: hypothetical protein VH268_10385 [Solirubrobacterales bacterium]|nr:hypothetical protein [Solirubrobacterales bacterium]
MGLKRVTCFGVGLALLLCTASATTAVAAPTAPVRVDPSPAVWVETMAEQGGKRGIRVGDAFYPNENPGSWAQVVLLDRATLKPVGFGNKSFGCGEARADRPQPESCAKPLQAAVKAAPGNNLVIVSNQVGAGAQAPYGLEWALDPFGVRRGPVLDGRKAGDFSAIATTHTGADWHMAPPHADGGAPGAMHGWLVRSNDGEYVFSAVDRVDFDTQAKGSDAEQNVVEVGDHRFVVKRDQHYPGGFQVVVLNPQTLEGNSRWFAIEAHSVAMADFLRKANEEKPPPLVIVSSIGDPRTAFYDKGDQPHAAHNENLKKLVDQVEQLGGTRNAFYRALDPGLSSKIPSYTLIARADSGGGNGLESEAATGSRINTRPLAGTLARTGPNWTFRVADAPEFGPVESGEGGADPSRGAEELTKVALQAPSRWPEAGEPKRTAAVRWIGETVLGTPDFRGQYWTIPFVDGRFDFGKWSEISTEVGKLVYVAGLGFEAPELEWAKDELRKEIGWLKSEHRYLAALSTPFSDTQLQGWAKLQQISNSVRDKVGVGGDQRTNANAKAVFEGIVSVLSALPAAHIGHAVHAVDSVYSMVMELVEINGKDEGEEGFQSRADEVGENMAKRFAAAQKMLDRQLPNVIAGDYEKLRRAGSCASTSPAEWHLCPYDHADWQFTQNDQEAAAEGLLRATEIWAYGELLPIKYTAWRLPPWWRRHVTDQFRAHGAIYLSPFNGEPESAQMAKPIYRNLPTYAHTIRCSSDKGCKISGDTWQITALAYRSGKGEVFDPWVMHFPEASITDKLFKPVGEGGFGLDPETFFDRQFKAKPFDEYPWAGASLAKPAWCLGVFDERNCG